MNTRDFLFPIIVIPVVIIFGLISALVLINNGKNAKLIAAKLRVGAFLLSFSWFAVSCTPTVECYAPAESNRISINTTDIQSMKPGETINGTIIYAVDSLYSYLLSDTLTGTEYQNGSIVNKFDKNNNIVFEIKLKDDLPKGAYNLEFFRTMKDSVRDRIDRYLVVID